MNKLKKTIFAFLIPFCIFSCGQNLPFNSFYKKSGNSYDINTKMAAPFTKLLYNNMATEFVWQKENSSEGLQSIDVKLDTNLFENRAGLVTEITALDEYREICVIPKVDEKNKVASLYIIADENFAGQDIKTTYRGDKPSEGKFKFEKIDENLYGKIIPFDFNKYSSVRMEMKENAIVVRAR